jgi:NAD(P)-dependent dehydrogenase (short-subunit alcohol dehydrogenase family)
MLARAPVAYRQAAAQAVPMRRIGRVEDVAAAAVCICSDQAASSPEPLPVDGGQLAGKA